MQLMRIWYDPPRVRWRRVAAIVAFGSFAVAAGIALQRGLWRDDAENPAAPAAALPGAQLPAAASAPRRVVARAVLPAASAPVAVAATAPSASDACSPQGMLRLAANTPQRNELRSRWLAGMQASGDERVRAAGWLLAMAGAGDMADARLQARRPACRDESGCERESDGAQTAAAEPARVLPRDRLAALAAESRDPLVQSYALQACRGAAGAGPCQQVSAEAWARLEPDNAAPWLALAAAPRTDVAAQADALLRATQASRLQSRAGDLHALAQAAAPAGASEIDRLLMAREIAAVRAAWLATDVADRHCNAPALRVANRRQVCEALADLHLKQAQTLDELRQARAIALHLGWPIDRVSAIREEADGLELLERQRAGQDEAVPCAALASTNGFFADVGRVGEVNALRELAKRAPPR